MARRKSPKTVTVVDAKNRSTRSRSKSGNRARPLESALVEQFQSGGMFRPTRDLTASTVRRAPIAATFSSRRAKGHRNNQGRSNGQSLPPIVSSYVDPWAEEASGVRYPDPYRGLSGTFVGTTVLSMVSGGTSFSDANMAGVTPLAGTSLFFCTPDPSNAVVQGICGTQASGALANYPAQFAWPNGSVYTGAAKSVNAFAGGSGTVGYDNTIGNLNGLRTLFSSARLVAGGVKLTSTMSFSSVSGTIHMAPYSYSLSKMTSNGIVAAGFDNPTLTEMFNGWQPALPQNLQAMAQLPGYVQYPLSSLEQNEMVAIFRRLGEEALLFKPTSTAWGMDDNDSGDLSQRVGDANLPNTVGHYGILVYIDGVLSSTGGALPNGSPLIELEYRCHYEAQPTTAVSILSTGGSNEIISTGGTSLCQPAPPYQPLVMAAADNLAADVPSVRCVDDAGVEESGFMSEVSRLWSSAVSVASSAYPAVSAAAGLLSSLAI